MKRDRLLNVGSLTLLLAIGLSGRTLAQERRVINPANFKPHGRPYSSSILAGDTLYLSGQGSRDAEGNQPQGFTAQMRQCLQNVRDILLAANMDFESAVWLTVYLTDLSNYEVMNRVYWETIGKNPPARTVLRIADLPAGNKVEINCIAVRDAQGKKSVWPSGWKRENGTDPPAVLAKDVLYLSAQGGRDQTSGKLAESLSDQAKQALENVGEVLKSAGMSHQNVVWVNPYMDHFKQYEEMNRVYASFFEFGNTPGRGTIEVAQLPGQNHIVLSCIAGADLAKRKAIRPRNMPPSPTASPGILYGDTLYLSAKSGFIPGQGIVTPDFELQLRQTMRNLLDGLEEANMDFSDVVSSVVYLKNMQDYDKMNNLYRTFFKDVYPARTTLQQSFDKETKTEEQISVIAVRKPQILRAP
jgi:reactive intermediate/imine deaminase